MFIVELLILLNAVLILENQCQSYSFNKKIKVLNERVNNLDEYYR